MRQHGRPSYQPDPTLRQRLTADIRLNGIKVPVLVTEDDEVLDGHHRLAIAAELSLAADRIPPA